MTELISIVALCVSVILLIVHYRNQIERRHGKISKLRSDFLQKVNDVQHRLLSIQMHLQTARLELRRLPECEAKYTVIEEFPGLIETAHNDALVCAGIQKELENFDTKKANRSSVLIGLQSLEHRFNDMDNSYTKLERDTLTVLKHIRSIQEAADARGI